MTSVSLVYEYDKTIKINSCVTISCFDLLHLQKPTYLITTTTAMNNDANTREGSKQNFLIRILIMSAFLALTIGVMGMTMLD